ncbi:MAG TPA: 5'-methylthioadenosine/S-adenosylhomocysteine nucleosidase [Thermomicrobiales bacterium]|nr:5'-methylthioadenosine/S-adenosylhomocysteine nucleosidase [Thermomicrobiales bacterium]
MSVADGVLVVCAMDSEAVHLREMLTDVDEQPVGRWRRSRGRLGEVPVDLVVSGIGLAYAAAATAAALMNARPRAVFNYGCAGAHRADIHAGDVVVASAVAHLASYVHKPDGTKHIFGFRLAEAEASRTLDQLPTDRELVEHARQAAEAIDLPPWPGRDASPQIHYGPVGSADIWTQHADTIQQLHATHQTLCEDMEAAALAQICALFGVPFLAIKDISNNELQAVTVFEAAESGANLLDGVEHEIGRRAAQLTAATIARLAATVEMEVAG